MAERLCQKPLSLSLIHQVTERTRFILAILDKSRALTLKCFVGSGWLLDLATNNVTKVGDKKYSSYRAVTVILAYLANSRAITPKCFIGSGWLLNLAEVFCQQTFSQSLMIIQ